MPKNHDDMKEHKLKIRIYPSEYLDRPLDSRASFWSYISKRTKNEDNNGERLEYVFRNKFARELKQDLKNKFQTELRDFERNYDIDVRSSYLDEFYHRIFRSKERDEKFYFDDFINGIAKLQELKNNYFKNNKEYQRLLNKNILATQIDFGIENISYSSLGFDLSIEPFEKAIQVFDNNFELFRVFLDQYIPDSFLSSLSIDNDNLPISVRIDYPNSFVNEFEKPLRKKRFFHSNENNDPETTSKWDKAKWIWSLANGSLVVPVILALVILFVTFNKMESIFKIRQENYQEIRIENDKVLKNYQELIDLQKKTYLDIIRETKNDTIKKGTFR